MTQPTHDATLFLGAAAYYTKGRPPYSDHLTEVLGEEVRLDRTGRLLDVGCGPGTLALRLAGHFVSAVAADPDPDMLIAAAREATVRGIDNIEWLQARAEDLALHDVGTFRLVTFGQSFHWTNREAVAEVVYELLEPGGVLALITHAYADRPVPPGPSEPPIPHEAIRALIATCSVTGRFRDWPGDTELVIARKEFSARDRGHDTI